MASKPANIKLWNVIVAQAKARFSTYPSPGASHWVHKQYVQHGGSFITTTAQTRKMDNFRKRHDEGKDEPKSDHRKDDDKDGKKDK